MEAAPSSRFAFLDRSSLTSHVKDDVIVLLSIATGFCDSRAKSALERFLRRTNLIDLPPSTLEARVLDHFRRRPLAPEATRVVKDFVRKQLGGSFELA